MVKVMENIRKIAIGLDTNCTEIGLFILSKKLTGFLSGVKVSFDILRSGYGLEGMQILARA